MIDNEAESRGWRGIAPAFFGDPGGTDFWPRGGALCRSFPGWRAGHRPDWIALDFRTMGRHCTALERSSMGTMREEESHDPYGSIHGRWTCACRVGGFGAKRGAGERRQPLHLQPHR